MNTSQPEVILPTSIGDASTVKTLSSPLNPISAAPNLNEATVLQGSEPEAPTSLNTAILTPPPTVTPPVPLPSPPKRKRQRLHFVNYLDDDESTQKRRSRRLKNQSHSYKYAKQGGKLKIDKT